MDDDHGGAPVLTWTRWQELQRRQIQAQQMELDDPDDFPTDAERDELHAQPCPACGSAGRWTRRAREVEFVACGHAFPVPTKPPPAPAPPPPRRPRGTAAQFMDYDQRAGTIAFEDGTLLATLKLMWTHFPGQGQYGEERWQITTTVAKDAYVPEGTMALDRVELDGVPPFTVDKAIIEVADPDAPRPVITIQWRPADRRDLEQ
ncbi:hypothetical protein ABZ352_18885 [Streptomyces griseofuscus]|uniref:hypothetical protein n=1 Tax=Streptomyces griseofuscus TaxID=146922 RepID=UPI003400F619